MAARGYLVRRAKKPNSGQKSAKGKRKKKLPPWDNSISNLLVYKPTQEELKRRHDIHQPIPTMLDSALEYDEQHSSARYNSGSDMRQSKSPESVNDERCSVLREMMDSNEKLQDALTYSDRRLSTVQDMFGDDPKTFRGFPNITSAPAQSKQRALRGGTLAMAAFMKEPSLGMSNLDILSDTIMDEMALNDVTNLKGDSMVDENNNLERTVKNDTPERSDSQQSQKCQQTVLSRDVSSFHDDVQHLSSSTVQHTHKVPEDGITRSSQLPPSTSTSFAGVPDMQKEREAQEDRVHGSNQHWKNDEKSRLPESGLTGLHDLRQMVDNLEEEVRIYEKETGREECSLNSRNRMKEKSSFGGFTVSILNVVTKLVGYLRECEIERKAEINIKEEIFHGFKQQQILIDALTNERSNFPSDYNVKCLSARDVIYMQEENKKLLHRFERYENTTSQEIAGLKHELFAVLKSGGYHTLSNDYLGDQNSRHTTTVPREQQTVSSTVTEDHSLLGKLRCSTGVACDRSPFGVFSGGDSRERNNEVAEHDATGTIKEDNFTETLRQNVETMPVLGRNANSVNIQTNTKATDTMEKTSLDGKSVVNVKYNYLESPRPNHQFASAEGFSRTPSELFSTNHLTTLSGDFSSSVAREFSSEYPRTLSSSDSVKHTAAQPSVFLGRNHSMSPRHYSTVPKQNNELMEEPRISLASMSRLGLDYGLNTDEIEKTEELSKSTLKATPSSGSQDVKRQILLTDEVPAKENKHPSQSEMSPAVSSAFYQSGSTSCEKIVVTLPSMWQDADTKSQKDTGRDSKYATKSDVRVIGKQKADQGWFALSTYVGQT